VFIGSSMPFLVFQAQMPKWAQFSVFFFFFIKVVGTFGLSRSNFWVFKNAVFKRFIFCDLVQNRTYYLRNRNLKRTLICVALYIYIYNLN
jgi:hypothetical protein